MIGESGTVAGLSRIVRRSLPNTLIQELAVTDRVGRLLRVAGASSVMGRRQRRAADGGRGAWQRL